MKKIAIEEHFSIPEHLEQFRLIMKKEYPVREVLEAEKQFPSELRWLAPSTSFKDGPDILAGKVLDMGEQRIKQMEEDGIDMQVVSLVSPGVQVFEADAATAMARKTNDALAKAVKKHPKKFAGLAAIAPQDPAGAAKELERAVKELGLKGASINSHTRGEYLDEKKFWPIFEMAERLGVPIYIHPRAPSPEMIKPYLAHPMLATAMSGFSAEVGLHALRLIVSGLFDKYPGAKIILGHLGESLPFWLWRLDNRWARMAGASIKKKPSDYFKENFYVTTSGNFSIPAFYCAYLELGAERILFAVDYPFEANDEGVKFMDTLPVSDGDKAKISHSNAESLFKL